MQRRGEEQASRNCPRGQQERLRNMLHMETAMQDEQQAALGSAAGAMPNEAAERERQRRLTLGVQCRGEREKERERQ